MTANRLDPQITALLEQMQEQGVPPVETMTPTQARETKNPVFFKLAAPAEVDAYARRLKEAGVSVRFRLFNGMIHGFFCWGGVIDRAGDAMDETAAALRSAGCTSDITL